MYKNLLILLISSFILHSCNQVHLSSDMRYGYYMNYFGKTLTSHFPTEYDSNDGYTYKVDTSAIISNIEEFNITFHKADEQIQSVKLKYKKNKKYSVTDSCIIVVNDFLNKDNEFSFTKDNVMSNRELLDYRSKYSKNCNGEYAVIPNFYDNPYADGSTRSKLSKDFKYIIVDSKTGFYSDKIDRTYSFMPEPVRHGYSKGIAYNEKDKIVIYWLVLW